MLNIHAVFSFLMGILKNRIYQVASISWISITSIKHTCVYSQRYIVCVCMLSCASLFATPWTVAHQVPLSCPPGKNTGLGFQVPTPRDLPDPGIDPMSLESPALAGGFFTTSATWELT